MTLDIRMIGHQCGFAHYPLPVGSQVSHQTGKSGDKEAGMPQILILTQCIKACSQCHVQLLKTQGYTFEVLFNTCNILPRHCHLLLLINTIQYNVGLFHHCLLPPCFYTCKAYIKIFPIFFLSFSPYKCQMIFRCLALTVWKTSK